MEATKYEAHFYGPVQGVVIGDNNTVTFVLQSGQQRTVPFLAPPRPPYDLVGRDDLLRNLKQRLFAGGSLALSALNGLPGVGKTALAVALAHDREVLEHFQDGVLWAGLGRQADVLALLGAWGAVLGIPSDEMAKLTSIEDRAKAIHAAIGMRCMLLVADDAWQVEVALAFKLGGPNCAHMVTTRLPEVAVHFASEGTTVVHELSETDGLTLLARLTPEVVETEPDEARELVQAVGGLPLALILMGNYLRVQAHSGQPRRLRAALDRLRQAEERLRLAQPQAPLERHPSLPVGTPLSLLAVIGISDEALDEMSRRTLRALSVFPPKPNTFSEEAALAVSTAPAETLDTLADYGLLESSGPGRYTLHQIIADYARVRLTDETAYKRMVEFFVHYVETHERDYGTLDLETSNVLAALNVAFDRGMQAALVRGANAFSHFLETRGLYVLAEVHLKRTQQAAGSLGDTVGLATALLNLGRISDNRGDYAQAEEYLLKGLALARKIGHRERISALLTNLGEVAENQGDYARAETYFQEGLALAREIGHRAGIVRLVTDLGILADVRGNYAQAEEHYQEALVLARELGRRDKVSALLTDLGVVAASRGNYARAEEYFQEGLALAREIGFSKIISVSLTNLGTVASLRGDYARAKEYLLEGLSLARKIGHRERISLLLTNLGWIAFSSGNYMQAEEYYQEGLAVAREIGHRENIARLLTNLGLSAANRGNDVQAEKYFRECLALAREMGHHRIISDALIGWGELYLKQQKLDSASAAFREALEVAQEMGVQEYVAFALYGLAQVAAAQGNTVEAYRQAQESLIIFETIGHYKAAEVAQWLTWLPSMDSLE